MKGLVYFHASHNILFDPQLVVKEKNKLKLQGQDIL